MPDEGIVIHQSDEQREGPQAVSIADSSDVGHTVDLHEVATTHDAVMEWLTGHSDEAILSAVNDAMAGDVLRVWGQPCPFLALPTPDMVHSAELFAAAAGQSEAKRRNWLQHASLLRKAVALATKLRVAATPAIDDKL